MLDMFASTILLCLQIFLYSTGGFLILLGTFACVALIYGAIVESYTQIEDWFQR